MYHKYQLVEEYKRNYSAVVTLPDFFFEPYDKHFSVREYLGKHWLNKTRIPKLVEAQCRKYNINQRYLLARMEFEQSALSVKEPVNDTWVYPDGKTDTATKVFKKICGYDSQYKRYAGMTIQIRKCAYRSRMIFDENSLETVVIDGVALYPKTSMECMALVYTPKHHTLESLKSIYSRLFGGDYADNPSK